MDFTPRQDFVAEFLNSDDCLDALMDAGTDIHNVFDSIAPRDTGRMVDSTHLEKQHTVRSWEVDLVVEIYYAKFVEFGTRYMRAQHNLRNALAINEAVNGR